MTLNAAALGGAALVGALFVACHSVSAWEYSGFATGMSLTRANAVSIERHDGVLRPIKGFDSSFQFGAEGANLSFCGDVLFAVNFNVAGGLEAYASLAEDLSSRYGQPTFFANHDFAENGSLAYVRTTWLDELGDKIDLSLTTYAGGDVTAGRSFSSHSRVCPQQ